MCLWILTSVYLARLLLMCVSRVNRMNIPCCHGNSICAPVRPLPHPSPSPRSVFYRTVRLDETFSHFKSTHRLRRARLSRVTACQEGRAWLPCASEHRAIFRSHDVLWLWACERDIRYETYQRCRNQIHFEVIACDVCSSVCGNGTFRWKIREAIA